MLRTLQFCLVNINIHKFFQFFGVYFYRYMLYMTGLSLWDSEHEHNTVNMLCSLKKKNCHITIPTGLPITATSQQGPLSSVPQVAIVERFDCIQNVQNINVLISQERRKQQQQELKQIGEKKIERKEPSQLFYSYSQQYVFKYMNSNEGLKYEFYTKYCFVRCCNNLPQKVQSPCRLTTPYVWCHTLK